MSTFDTEYDILFEDTIRKLKRIILWNDRRRLPY